MPTWDKDAPLERAVADNGRRETKRANQGFRDYAFMGVARSLGKLLTIPPAAPPQPPQIIPVTRSIDTLKEWCKSFAWVERASRFDEIQQANVLAEYEAHWKKKIMGSLEVLGRLSEMGRASVFPFIKISSSGVIFFDFSAPEAKDYLHLIKKIKTKRTRRVDGRGENAEEWEDEWVEVELHDALTALVQVGKAQQLFVEPQESTPKEAERQVEHDERFDQSISKLADAIRESVSSARPEQDGGMDSSEQAAMAGIPVESG